MLTVYRSEEDRLLEIEAAAEAEKGDWFNLINPTNDEILLTAEETGIYEEFLRYPLDDEELPRVESEDDQIMIIVNIPVTGQGEVLYETMPLGIILNDDYIVTVCLEEIDFASYMSKFKNKDMATFKKTRFIFQLLQRETNRYLRYLRDIDRRHDVTEAALRKNMSNEGLSALSQLQKSLVYFTTALRSNDKVMEKLMRTKTLKMYEEDRDLLDDVIIENRQAIEMADVYSNICRNTMDTLSSITSNNLNRIMNFLTIITIVVAVPTFVTGFFGMNVPMPFSDNPWTTLCIFVLCITAGVCSFYFLKRMK
ncbi:MAG: magnesium transporter CorA family protein [Bacillota bacterium]|jgi:magnesium transporter